MVTHPNPPIHRLILGAAYVLLTGTGVAGFFVYSKVLSAALGVMTVAWAAFLLVGGALGVFAALTDRWIGELTGIPLLSTSLIVYGIAIWVVGRSSVGFIIGALMLSLALTLLARWRNVVALAKTYPTDRRKRAG